MAEEPRDDHPPDPVYTTSDISDDIQRHRQQELTAAHSAPDSDDDLADAQKALIMTDDDNADPFAHARRARDPPERECPICGELVPARSLPEHVRDEHGE